MIKADKILIRAPNWVGDVVMATPAFRCIRKNFPSSEISVLLKPYVNLILQDSPWFDHYIGYKDKIGLSVKGYSGYRKLTRHLKNEKYDVGFIFPNSFSSAFMFWLAGVKKRIGYLRDARGLFLTDGVKRETENGKFKPTYMADYYLKLCYLAGCAKESNNLELFYSKDCETRIEKILDKYNILNSKPLILINPGAAYGSSKCWHKDGFAEVIDMINKNFDCHTIIVSGPNEADLANDIEIASKSAVYNFSKENITLDLLKPLIKRSALLLTVDSGPRHFAVAFNIPTVVLMGPTDPRYTKTDWEKGEVIQEIVECGPCHKKICPTDHKCMNQISSQKVFAACEKFLKDI